MGMFKSPRSTGSSSKRTRRLALLTVAIVMVVMIGVLVSACGGTLGSTDTTGAATSAAATGTAATQAAASSSTTLPPASPGEASPAQSVATVLGPSVVNIKVSGTSGASGFGQQRQYAAEGSGVIYRSDGMIITNNHVVSDEASGDPVSTIQVTFATGETLDGHHRRPRSSLRPGSHQSPAERPAARRQVRGRSPEGGGIRHRHR